MKKRLTFGYAKHPVAAYIFCLTMVFALLTTPIATLQVSAQVVDKSGYDSNNAKDVEMLNTDVDVLPGFDFKEYEAVTNSRRLEVVGTDLGSESEPNDTSATADALTGTDGRIRGLSFSGGPPASIGTDTDFYSFTTTDPNSKIFAATQTSGSGGGQNTNLAVLASDGTTLIEADVDDGSMASTAATIAGAILPTPGTYYLRVTNGSATAVIASYELYFGIRSGSPTAETEPNNSGGTPNPIPASGFMSGAINPAADNDTFSFSANAGDTIAVVLDLDPERDNVQWNGRLGIGTFGTPPNILVVNDTSTGSATNPLSEAIFIQVKNTGTQFVYVDEPAGGGSATSTYNFSITTIPAAAFAGTCTTYSNNTSTPITDAALTTSTITIPDSKIISSLRATISHTHTNPPDLDISLRTPANNDIGLILDTGVGTQTGAQVYNLMDEAVIPITFPIANGVVSKPIGNRRLHWAKGLNTLGNWNLDIRDDLTGNTGTLNSWSLEVCEEPAPTGNLVYSQDFETNNGGFTSAGTANEWEFGTPATAATTGTNPIAGFINCASGLNCWKTDLDNTYEASSIQDLTSPSIDLTTISAPVNLSWSARYQIENPSFDRIWVRVTEVGNPTNTRVVWLNDGATQTLAVGTPTTNIGSSAGWGTYRADISDFAGKNVQVIFHLNSDTSVQLGGFAIDDVSIRGFAPAVPSTVTGKVETAAGRGIANVQVTLTEQNGTKHVALSNSFGYFRFFGILSQQNITLSANSKRYAFSSVPITLGGDVFVSWTGNPNP